MIATAKGFTLLEVLIALVIVAASSSIILAHLRTLMDMNSRLRTQQQEVTLLFNQAAEFPLFDYSRSRLRTKPPILELYANDGKKAADIENFSENIKNLPPIDKLYTPYQTYSIKKSHRQITLLLLGMPYDDKAQP